MRKQKDTAMAYLFMAFSLVGFAGLHRFYLGKIGTGILYLLTWGWFGIGLIYDLFTLPRQVENINRRHDFYMRSEMMHNLSNQSHKEERSNYKF